MTPDTLKDSDRRAQTTLWRVGTMVLVGVLLASLLFLAGPAQSQDGEAGAAEVELAPELIDPGIPTEALAYHVIPLTKGELDPLAQGWLGIVQSKRRKLQSGKSPCWTTHRRRPMQPIRKSHGWSKNGLVCSNGSP